MAKKLQYIGSMTKILSDNESIIVPEGEIWRIQAVDNSSGFRINDAGNVEFANRGSSGAGYQSFILSSGTKITYSPGNAYYKKAVVSALKFKEVEI